MEAKICTKCGLEKDIDCFKKKRNQCNKCRAEYLKLYYEINKEELDKYNLLRYYKDHENNKLKQLEYRKNNKDKRLLYRKNYEKTQREVINKWARKYRKSLPDCYIKELLSKNGVTDNVFPEEMIETKRLIIQLKRELIINKNK
jgi:hypothetical protein